MSFNKLLITVIALLSSQFSYAHENSRNGRINLEKIERVCEESMTFSSNVDQCVKNSRGSASAIRVCAKRYTFSRGQLECIKNAKSGYIVKYCFDEYTFDSKIKKCIIELSEDGAESPIIKIACEEAFNFSSEISKCKKNAVGSPHAVRACAKSFTFFSEQLECLKVANKASDVKYCVKKFNFDSDRIECIEEHNLDY